ncbi:hypothetical protein NL533_35145, partial [Klebsiella pneumoniae]|nr:hypothetical protein [Klebsiella pneumoniae]
NGSIVVTLTRIGSTTGDVTVTYTASDNTARTDGSAANGRDDYDLNGGTNTGTITWADSVGGDLTFTIDVLPDDLNEGKE